MTDRHTAPTHPAPEYSISDCGSSIIEGYSGREVKITPRRQPCGKKYARATIRGKTLLVHRVVAETFCDLPRDRYPVAGYGDLDVNHIDGDGLNNRAENLEWVSHGDNMRADASRRVRENLALRARADTIAAVGERFRQIGLQFMLSGMPIDEFVRVILTPEMERLRPLESKSE